MLADPTQTREVDLSHLTTSLAELGAGHQSRSTVHYLLVGLFVSVLLHSLLFLWKTDKIVLKKPVYPITLTLNYNYIAQEPQPLPAKPEEPVISNTPPPTKTSRLPVSADKLPETAQKPRIITTLSQDEMREIYEQKTVRQVPQKMGNIGDNVFNPALRERLIAEANKPDFQRVTTGLNTYTDPSGATVVNVENNPCLRASGDNKVGAERNWYMTGCGGKSESEKMIERINHQIRK